MVLGKHTQEGCPPTNVALLVRKQLFVCLIRSETDGHFRNNSCHHGAKTFV